MKSKSAVVLLIAAFYLGSPIPSFAQHYLACRGSDQVLIDGKTVFQMKEGTDYPVVGISGYGDFLIRTGYGSADYKGNRFRVLEGGQYASVRAGLKDVKKGVMEHWQENKMGWHSQSWYSADWSGQLVVQQTLNQCYAAFQWYVNGKPVSTDVQKIGKLETNRLATVSLRVPVESDKRDGTYSFHIWSGGYELRTFEIEESQDKW